MPHFVIDCSEHILNIQQEEQIIKKIHTVAVSTGLFTENEIKVRVNPFKTYLVGNKKDDFIHVFSNIMEGRTTEQKASLSKAIVKQLVLLFPDVSNIAVNIREFEKSTYCNKDMLISAKD